MDMWLKLRNVCTTKSGYFDARRGHVQWIPGAFIAIACGAIYFALRPPLFDNDGYRDRLYALNPGWVNNTNPHHLLWNFIQAYIGSIGAAVGCPTTVPFQVVGIVAACLTLFVLFLLLFEVSNSVSFAAAAATFIAFSPKFWILVLQNRCYFLLFLVLVLFLYIFHTDDVFPPTGSRLVIAGSLLFVAITLQQGTALLVPAATVSLIAYHPDGWKRRLVDGLVFGGTITLLVLAAYLAVWLTTAHEEQSLFRWVALYAYIIHSPNIFEFSVPMLFVKSVIGISRMLLQSAQIISFLQDNFSNRTIVAIYASLGLVACTAGATIGWLAHLGRPVVRLVRSNALIGMSLLWILFWSAFVFAWEPVSPGYWTLDLFPALVCLGSLLRDWITWRLAYWLVAGALVISTWNGYGDFRNDKNLSRNFPPPLLEAIHQHLAPHDLFIVLAEDDGLGGMDYELLFVSLQYSQHNPGLAILNDFVWPIGDSTTWRARLGKQINSTMDLGGHIFVAAHVFDPTSYDDLAGTDDPFAIMVTRQYPANQAQHFEKEVQKVFAPYNLERSDFSIGSDKYFLLERKVNDETTVKMP